MKSKVRVRPMEPGGPGEIAAALDRYPYLPYTDYEQVKPSHGAAKVRGDVETTVGGSGFGLVAEGSEGCVGIVTGQPLPWDSDQLGVSAGRLTHLITWGKDGAAEALIEEAVAEFRKRGTVHLSCRVPSGDVGATHALEACGFRLMEALLTFGFRMGRDEVRAEPRGFQVAPWDGTEEEIRWIRQVARSAFHQDRFHSDPYIPKARADALHESWMENSCRGFADVVLVAKDGASGQRLGFFSGKVHRIRPEFPVTLGNLVLGAVAPEGRGRGVFTDLTLAGLEWARPQVDILEIGTQFTNVHASRVYLGVGFRFIRSEVTLRRWIES